MGIFRLSIKLRELIDQRALPCSRSTGKADDTGFARVRKESFQEIRPSGRAVFDRGDGAGEGARVAGTDVIDQRMSLACQAISVKQERQRKTLGRDDECYPALSIHLITGRTVTA